MIPSKPYLVRALNEWILDNDLTPHILVDAEKKGVLVPGQFVENGKIILNISPTAVKDLQIDNECISFSARFSGNAYNLLVPITTILAIYAREDKMVGMIFPDEPEDSSPATGDEVKSDRSHLKVVK